MLQLEGFDRGVVAVPTDAPLFDPAAEGVRRHEGSVAGQGIGRVLEV